MMMKFLWRQKGILVHRLTEIAALQLDNQNRQAEVGSGYPTREQLQEDEKLLVFYTGIPHFTLLLACSSLSSNCCLFQ